jgi:hypothetical protein
MPGAGAAVSAIPAISAVSTVSALPAVSAERLLSATTLPAAALPTRRRAAPTGAELLIARALEFLIDLVQQQFESSWEDQLVRVSRSIYFSYVTI